MKKKIKIGKYDNCPNEYNSKFINQVLSLVLSIFNPSKAEYGKVALTVMGGMPGNEIGVVIDIACVGNEGTIS